MNDRSSSLDLFDSLLDDRTGRSIVEELSPIAAALEAAESVLISAHLRPDGDAFGSEAALALGLRSLGKKVRVLNDAAPSESYLAVLPQGLIESYDEGIISSLPGTFDTCVLLDTSEPERAGLLEPVFVAPGTMRICVDHHRTHGEYPWDRHLVASAAPATGCLVLALLDRLGVDLDVEMAQALWLAIATDTGWFRFANTDSIALGCAARLLTGGVEPERLYRVIYGSYSPVRTRTLGRLLDDLRLELDGRLVWTLITRQTVDESGVSLAELDGVIDHLKTVRGAEVAAVVTEIDVGAYKVSLRAVGDVNVERLASSFGGGGHDRAAGYRFSGKVEELIQRLADRLPAQGSA